MNKPYTDAKVGNWIRQGLENLLPVLAATYTAGFIFGQLVHRLNDKLAQVVK